MQGMHRAVKIEVYVPGARAAFLEDEMKHGLGAFFLIESTAGVPVSGEVPGKIRPARERRVDHRPGVKSHPHATKSINVSHTLHGVPKTFGLKALQQQ